MQRVIERILNLLAFLLTAERPVTADEIRITVAGYDQSSDAAWRRMFERDKDLLRQLGIPLQMQATDAFEVEFGYRVPRADYSLEDPGLTDEERAALWLAAKVVRIGGQAAGPDAIFKLGGAPMAAAGEPLAADLGAGQQDVAEAFAAVTSRTELAFTYRDRRRLTAPYGLVHRRGHWYLVAEDRGDATVKVFRMDRIDTLEAKGGAGAFEKPAGLRPADQIPEVAWEAGGDDIVAVVRFDEPIAWWARRQLAGDTDITEQLDGGFVATIRVANPDAFIGWLISFEDAAELLEPEELRTRLVSRVAAAS
jgi:predicted DNA-binding transcriptional regulator YafY